MCSMLKELDPHAPSLGAIKAIQLPKFKPPQKVTYVPNVYNHYLIIIVYSLKFLSTSGIPFYVNLPTTIVANCLLKIETASKLERYPVVTIGPAKYEKPCYIQ